MTRRLGQVELFGEGRLGKGKKKIFGSLPGKIPGNRKKKERGRGVSRDLAPLTLSLCTPRESKGRERRSPAAA